MTQRRTFIEKLENSSIWSLNFLEFAFSSKIRLIINQVANQERRNSKNSKFRDAKVTLIIKRNKNILGSTFPHSASRKLDHSSSSNFCFTLHVRRCLHEIYNFNRFFDDSRRNFVLFRAEMKRVSSSSCHCVIRTAELILNGNIIVSNITMKRKARNIHYNKVWSLIAWYLIP